MQFKISESQLQILIFDWCHLNRNKYPELELLFHIPNGGYRNIATAKRLKAEGVKSGVPDLLLPIARVGYYGLFLEVKTKGGVVSENQARWLKSLSEQGYLALVVYSFDEAIGVIKDYIKMERRETKKEGVKNEGTG